MTIVYVTKYALTEGPWAVDAELNVDGKSASWNDAKGYRWFMHGKDFHLTKDDALADCERRRKAKIASIEKQKAKLEKMTFTLKDGGNQS